MRNYLLAVPVLLFNFFVSFNFVSQTPYKQYKFAIDIWHRTSQAEVENPGNWRFLGDAEEIPSCGPGNLQACQLVVDERDTKLLKDGSRALKSSIKISALLNSRTGTWFVANYSSSGSYPYKVLNEEDEKKHCEATNLPLVKK